jgi:hypothetical protein
LQSVINFVETSWSLQPRRKAVFLDADTSMRRAADTLPQLAANFERNDIIIICETVH